MSEIEDLFNDDSLPPHSIEDEQGVLGCILICPDCLNECDQLTHLHFYDLKHQNLFQGIRKLSKNNDPIDLITLGRHFRDNGGIEKVGGLGYVSSLSDTVPSAANLAYYMSAVLEKYSLRKMVQTCTGITRRCYDFEGETASLIAEAEKSIIEICDEFSDKKEQTVAEIVGEIVGEWEWAQQHPGQISGISTGLIDLDNLIGGWQKQNLTVIGARPSQGKTALLMGFARAAAIENKIPTLVVTCESTKRELIRRMACQIAGSSQQNLRRGYATQRDFERLPAAFSKIAKAPLYWADCIGSNITHVQSAINKHKRKHGIQLAVVDYLQKIKPAEKNEKRTYEVAQSSEGLKTAACRNDIAVVTAAQVNREPEKQKGRKSILSDLADSGQIERDADIVGLIQRKKDDQGNVSYSLDIAKFRDGPVGLVDLHFTPECARFDNAAKIDQGDAVYNSPHSDP